jgi:hypothetical protein
MSWVIVGLVSVILVETAVMVVSISRTRTRERTIKQLADGTTAAARLLATALEPSCRCSTTWLARTHP